MSDTAFRTFQTVKRYEEALARHAQWVRWVRAIRCPCINPNTRQPDPNCAICNGHGQYYRTPGVQSILQEQIKHNSYGKLTPGHIPVTGTPIITLRGIELSLGVQPVDGSYIQLAEPFPAAYEPVIANYDYSPIISVTDEDSEIVAINTLRVITARFTSKGKSFEGSIDDVTRVYNVDKEETYTVSSYAKEYIYLDSMGTYAEDDVLEVDYDYVNPFVFMLSQVSMKMRYEMPYVHDDADAVLVVPYWAKPSPDDLFTTMAAEQFGQEIVDPTHTAGNDVAESHYDLSKLIEVIDKDGVEYTVGVGNNVELFGRNEIKWNIAKPTIKYTVTFHYHPTYVALDQMPTLRTSENKSFVNRVSLKLFDRTDPRVI